ncbi:MAG: hypothetical protein ABSA47_18725 [Verrucomicrobiota bacterium]
MAEPLGIKRMPHAEKEQQNGQSHQRPTDGGKVFARTEGEEADSRGHDKKPLYQAKPKPGGDGVPSIAAGRQEQRRVKHREIEDGPKRPAEESSPLHGENVMIRNGQEIIDNQIGRAIEIVEKLRGPEKHRAQRQN